MLQLLHFLFLSIADVPSCKPFNNLGKDSGKVPLGALHACIFPNYHYTLILVVSAFSLFSYSMFVSLILLIISFTIRLIVTLIITTLTSIPHISIL